MARHYRRHAFTAEADLEENSASHLTQTAKRTRYELFRDRSPGLSARYRNGGSVALASAQRIIG
jgi:hypothetical protein